MAAIMASCPTKMFVKNKQNSEELRTCYSKKIDRAIVFTINNKTTKYELQNKQFSILNDKCPIYNTSHLQPPLPSEMCTLSSYSPLNTDLASTGVKPSLTDPQYLQVGFSVSISCKSADYAQPLGAASSHTCNLDHGDDPIVIENCNSKCGVIYFKCRVVYTICEYDLLFK